MASLWSQWAVAVHWRRELMSAHTFSAAPTTAFSRQCVRHLPNKGHRQPLLRPPRRLCHFDMWVLRIDVQEGKFRLRPKPVCQMVFSTFRVAARFNRRRKRRRKTGTWLSFLYQTFAQLLRGTSLGQTFFWSDLLYLGTLFGPFERAAWNSVQQQNCMKNFPIKPSFAYVCAKSHSSTITVNVTQRPVLSLL